MADSIAVVAASAAVAASVAAVASVVVAGSTEQGASSAAAVAGLEVEKGRRPAEAAFDTADSDTDPIIII